MGNRPSTARPHPPSAQETSPLARLGSRLTRSVLADSAITARQAYQLRAIRIDEPLLVVPLTGAKQVRPGGGVRRCEGGGFLACHRAQTLDVENLPAGGHAYRALALGFPWRLVELARALLNEHPVAAPAEEPVTVGALELILPALLDMPRVDAALAQVRARGLAHEVSLIFGLPGQDISSFLASVRWCLDRSVPVIKAFPLMLLRGTALDRERARWGLVEDGAEIPCVVESQRFTRDDWLAMARVAEALALTEGRHPAGLEELLLLADGLVPDRARWQAA